MKRLLCALFVAFAATVSVRAQAGPDDIYVRAFSMIEEANSANRGGQFRAAYDKFSQAEAMLKDIQKSNPNWNPSLVQLRLGLVEEALAALKPKLPAGADPAPTKPPAPDSSAPLTQQIQYLQAQNAALEAKLREALSVQSGALSIAEKARLEGELSSLAKEHEVLVASLKQEKERAAAADKKAKELEALAADGKKARETAKANAELESTVKDLGRQVARLQDGAKTDAAKSSEAVKAAEARSAALQKQLDETRRSLGESDSRLAALASSEAKAKSLAADKVALEKEMARLRTELSQKPKAPERNAAVEAEIAALKSQLKQTRESQDAEQAKAAALSKELKTAEERATKSSAKQLKQLQDDLAAAQKKLGSTESKLRDATAKRKGGTVDPKVDELQARLAAIEAKAVPYTKEEQALIKTATPSGPFIIASATNSAPTEKKSVRRIPPGAIQLVTDAERDFASRRFAEAEQKFATALRQDENNVYLLANLAAAQFELGKLDDCEKNLVKASKIDADDPATLTLLGTLRIRQDRFDDALTALSKSARLNPENADTQNYLGIALSQQGQRAAAEAALRKSLQLQPDNPSAHHNLAIIYATQKPAFTELARFHYGKALALGHPKNPELEKTLDSAK